jgi:hypothetical protein
MKCIASNIHLMLSEVQVQPQTSYSAIILLA